MVSVAWIASHQLFQGAIGGAEFADEHMIQRRPSGWDVSIFRPNDAGPQLRDFDFVVVSGVHGIHEEPMKWLMEFPDKITYWAHGDLTLSIYSLYLPLYQAVRNMVLLTPDHVAHHQSFLRRDDLQWNPGWFDVHQPIFAYPHVKEDYAIWPHRQVWSKGLLRAQYWAEQRGIELVQMSDKPRAEVLSAMAKARWFVLLSEIFDAGPWSAIEAQLLRCELVVDRVGLVSTDRQEVEDRVSASDEMFWRVVSCESQ